MLEKIRPYFDVISTAAVLVTCAALLLRGGKGPVEPPAKVVSIEDAGYLGPTTARMAIVEFSDFECSFCRQFAREVFPLIKTNYIDTGKMAFVLKHYPISKIHPFAHSFAVANECAGLQGKFWPFVDWAFSLDKLESQSLTDVTRRLKLEPEAFGACTRGAGGERVADNLASAKALGVTGTPEFVIGEILPSRRVKVVRSIHGLVSWPEIDGILSGVISGLGEK